MAQEKIELLITAKNEATKVFNNLNKQFQQIKTFTASFDPMKKLARDTQLANKEVKTISKSLKIAQIAAEQMSVTQLIDKSMLANQGKSVRDFTNKATQEYSKMYAKTEAMELKKQAVLKSQPSITNLVNKSTMSNQGKSTVDMVNSAMLKYDTTLKKVAISTKKVAAETKKMSGWWEKSKQGVLGFNGSLLSVMFLGMQLQKTFTGALTAIFEGFKKAIPESHKFNQMTNTLSANWEFFKFQLADALAQSPLFQKFIEGLIGILKWLQKLSPTSKMLLVIAAAFMVVIGTVMLWVGVLGLGIASLIDLGIAMGITSTFITGAFARMATAARTFWLAVSGPIGIFIAVLGSALALAGVLFSNFFIDEGKEINGFWNNMYAGAITFVSGLANIFVLLITTLGALFVGFGTMLDVVWSGIWESVKQVASAIKNAFFAALRGDDISDAFTASFNVDTIKDKMATAFDKGVTQMKLLADGSSLITSNISKWNMDKLEGLSTDVAGYVNTDVLKADLDSNLASLEPTSKQNTSTQIINFNEGSIQPILSGAGAAEQANEFADEYMKSIGGNAFISGN